MNLQELFETLTGQPTPIPPMGPDRGDHLFRSGGIGYSQINELLLMRGYDRVSNSFFQYLVDGTPSYKPGSALASIDQLGQGVERFQQHALIRFGNFKYAFKHLSNLSEGDLADFVLSFQPRQEAEFARRHAPVQPTEMINGDETYYLGYLIKRELDERLKDNPDDQAVKEQLQRRQSLVEMGIRNHEGYLASDHMDVYVATSMREKHEYAFVSRMTAKIFESSVLAALKLRWFDPTQAYCHDRVDKGLSEALMLKRAACTLYFAQETDTLGKDSELASTLAQGKPVIAYIPELTNETEHDFTKDLLRTASRLYPTLDERQLIMRQLQIFDSDAAWRDPGVRKWLDVMTTIDVADARAVLTAAIRRHYDKRADTLRLSHPLGIQVHLETGVANGVLVARTPEQCAELIRRIVTNRLEFAIEVRTINQFKYLLLRERISDSIFRVVSGDQLLTNAFWNFYLRD